MTLSQEGIFYNRMPYISANDRVNRSRLDNELTFAILFLRVSTTSCKGIKRSISRLWRRYEKLSTEVDNYLPHVRRGKLSFLIGFGPNIFNHEDIKKKIPEQFRNRQFLRPTKGGGPILDGSGIKYSSKMPINLGLSEDIAIQCIGRGQAPVHLAVVETWRHVTGGSRREEIRLSRFYTGFQRADRRNWLGFHEGISNMSSSLERKKAIFIDPVHNDLRHRDYWTKGGTYLAYMRIQVNLIRWEKIGKQMQEMIVGRNKETGSPLIGIDRRGRPIFQGKLGTSGRIPRHHSSYVDHPDYFSLSSMSRNLLKRADINKSIRILSQSHIGRTRHIDGIGSERTSSRRIFRQGFDFIEPVFGNNEPFRVGQNFVSFQNDLTRLFFILTDPNWMGGSNFGGEHRKSAFIDFLSVLAAGVFYVPADERPFPGASIF